MSGGVAVRGLAAVFAVAVCAAIAHAQGPQEFDAPYIVTPQVVVDRMLALADVKPTDVVVDLGSGDGRLVITAAAKFGARGFGVDIDERLVGIAEWNARRAGVADRARFYAKDLFTTDFREASVVTLYLFPEMNVRLRPKLLQDLRPGSRVLSHDWGMGDWQADATIVVPAPDKPVGMNRESTIRMWIIPGDGAGRWDVEVTAPAAPAFTVDFAQAYQMLSGQAVGTGARSGVQGRMVGNEMRFTIPAPAAFAGDYAGIVEGNIAAGKVIRGGAEAGTWRARRSSAGTPR